MPIITDRDLLALEPGLFRDTSFLGQQLFKGTVSLSAGVLTAVTGNFSGADITAGHVILVDDRPLEVLARPSSNTLTVSLVRWTDDAPAIPPADFTSRVGIVTTFAPQIRLIYDQLLRDLGLDPAAAATGGPGESAMLNPQDLEVCQALGALHIIHAAAAAGLDSDSPALQRAAHYRARYAAERARVRIRIDTDGDGLTNATRTLTVAHLIR